MTPRRLCGYHSPRAGLMYIGRERPCHEDHAQLASRVMSHGHIWRRQKHGQTPELVKPHCGYCALCIQQEQDDQRSRRSRTCGVYGKSGSRLPPDQARRHQPVPAFVIGSCQNFARPYRGRGGNLDGTTLLLARVLWPSARRQNRAHHVRPKRSDSEETSR